MERFKIFIFIAIPIIALIFGGYFTFKTYHEDQSGEVFSSDEVRKEGQNLFPDFQKSRQGDASGQTGRDMTLNDIMNAPAGSRSSASTLSPAPEEAESPVPGPEAVDSSENPEQTTVPGEEKVDEDVDKDLKEEKTDEND